MNIYKEIDSLFFKVRGENKYLTKKELIENVENWRKINKNEEIDGFNARMKRLDNENMLLHIRTLLMLLEGDND